MPRSIWHIIYINLLMKNFFIAALLWLIAGCGQNEKNAGENEIAELGDRKVTTANELRPGCYRMVIKRDTAEMKIEVRGDSVSGDLFYNPFETDSNFGKFRGTFRDSIIRAWYTFESEGMVSYREVVYKLIGEELVEGYGDIEMSNDSAWFKYPHTLKFEDDHPFKKVSCN